MHSRRSVLNTLLLTGALAFAPSLASAQDAPAGDTSTGTNAPTQTQTTKTTKKKDTSKKKKKGDKSESEQGSGSTAGSLTGAQVQTKIDEGTPDESSGNPSVVIAPGPTAQGPGVIDNGTGGGTTDAGGSGSGGAGTGTGTGTGSGAVPVVPPPISPEM